MSVCEHDKDTSTDVSTCYASMSKTHLTEREKPPGVLSLSLNRKAPSVGQLSSVCSAVTRLICPWNHLEDARRVCCKSAEWDWCVCVCVCVLARLHMRLHESAYTHGCMDASSVLVRCHLHIVCGDESCLSVLLSLIPIRISFIVDNLPSGAQHRGTTDVSGPVLRLASSHHIDARSQFYTAGVQC